MHVLVTRPGADGEALLARLTEQGYDGLHEPLLMVNFQDGPNLDTLGVQAYLTTSSNGVRALLNRDPDMTLPLYAVGDATAATARELGFIQVHSAEGDVDALAALATDMLDPKNGALYHAAGSVQAGLLKETLETAGFECRRNVLYESEPAKSFSPEAIAGIKSGKIDTVLLYSPRTAETFVKLLRKARLVRAAKHLTLICLSPAVASKTADLSWQERRVAKAPTQDALLEALVDTSDKTASAPAMKNETYVPNNVSPESTLPKHSTADRPAAATVTPPYRQKNHTVRTVFMTLLFSAVAIGAGAATSDLWMPKLRDVVPLPIFGVSTIDQIDDLAGRLLRLESKSNDSLPKLEELQTERNRLQYQLDTTLTRIRSLERSLDSVKTMIAAVDASNGSDSAEATLKKLSERLSLLEAGEGSIASETRKRLGVLTQQVAAIETKIPVAATADQSVEARAFLLAVGQLRTAVRAGRSFSNELQILTNLKFKETDLAGTVTDLLQTAEQGVPSLDQLRQEFAQLAGVIVQAGNLPKGKGLVDRTLARLAHSLKWRRTDDFNGVGVEAVVARAERALGQSDLAGAVTELKALTAAPALKVETWLKNAEALISVDTVLNRLQIKAVTLLTINE